MRKAHVWALAALVGGLVLGLAPRALSQKTQVVVPGGGAPPAPAAAPAKAPDTLKGQIAAASKLKEEDVEKVLAALGPAVADQLAKGRQVELPGLGTVRVVRVPEHRDLVGGRPATVAGVNTVEFIAGGRLAAAANSPGAQPAEVVPPFEYVPLPGQTKGMRTPGTRTPTARTP
jgi:nucleoid DNA-binding protein